jgi:tetratricopeptide (TPR) repeat protein
MSWIGWLVLAAVLAILVAVLQAVVQLGSWLLEQFTPESSEPRHPKPSRRPPQAEPDRAAQAPEPKHKHAHMDRPTLRLPVSAVSQARRPSRLGRWWKRLRVAVAHKSFDCWVTTALAEDDPELKIQCLSKALSLNPDYLPAWGLKGNALLGLGRYDEAIQCFDRSLELRPSALIWQRKGDCYYRLHKLEEALRCFHKALETCPDQDRELHDEILSMIRLAEREARRTMAS